MTEDAPLPRYRVTGGGTATPEQLAALVVALTPVPVAPEASRGPAATEAPRPGWQRAALLEAAGARAFTSVDDLRAHDREH